MRRDRSWPQSSKGYGVPTYPNPRCSQTMYASPSVRARPFICEIIIFFCSINLTVVYFRLACDASLAPDKPQRQKALMREAAKSSTVTEHDTERA